MAKLDVMCDGGKPYSGKREREFFSTDVNPLILSEGSQRIKENPCNGWLFQLINIYQGKPNFQNVAQVWNFTKTEKEVWAVCEDLQGNVLTFLGINLLEFHQMFNDVTLYVADGRCMMKEEQFSSLEILLSA